MNTPKETQTCKGCGNAINPDRCGCGENRKSHESVFAGHSFIPEGCTCLAKLEKVIGFQGETGEKQ